MIPNLTAVTHAEQMHFAALAAVAGVAGLLAWAGVTTALAAATRPRLPEAARATMDLRAESPAVASYLAHRWKTVPSAAPATLLDLAARHVLEIDETRPNSYVVRLRQTVDDTTLAPYERRVLALVRRRASADGSVPAAALDLGATKDASSWMASFRQEVRDDARQRGLSRRRWPAVAKVVIAVVALIPAAALGLALGLLAAGPSANGGSNDGRVGFYAGCAIWLLLSSVWAMMRADRETCMGSEAAAHWLGVRAALGADLKFGTLPPPAVAIWDRLLAYGAGLDVARAAVRALPLGAEDPHHAWSPYGGSWRFVRIRHRRRPGWGKTRGAAFWGGVGGIVRGAFLVAVPVGIAAIVVGGVFDISPGSGFHRYRAILPVGVVGVALPGIAVLIVGVLGIGNSVWSIGRPAVWEGTVLRQRQVWTTNESGSSSVKRSLVVDDGRSAVLDLWLVPPSIRVALLEEGLRIRVSSLRRLGRIIGIEPLAPGPAATTRAGGVAGRGQASAGFADAPTTIANPVDVLQPPAPRSP